MRALGGRLALVLKGEEDEAADRVVMGWRGFSTQHIQELFPSIYIKFKQNLKSDPVLWPRGV